MTQRVDRSPQLITSREQLDEIKARQLWALLASEMESASELRCLMMKRLLV
jgi:hypothetical protein